MRELYHHGIKGQKWGVRRYQNLDGTYTNEGKRRLQAGRNVRRNIQYTRDKNDIVRSLSAKEHDLLGSDPREDWIPEDQAVDISSNIAKSFVTRYNDLPVSFLEIYTNGGRTGQIAIATRNDPMLRGKGLADANVKKAIEWVERYGRKSIDELEWYAHKENIASNRLAVKNGFIFDREAGDGQYNLYSRKVRKE